MARLRVRLRFNPGRTGTPMDKLGEFSTRTERFLRSLTLDLALPAKKGDWLALQFSNESVAFDGEYPASVPDAVQVRALEALTLITSDQPLTAVDTGFVSVGTAASFARIGEVMDPDERFYVGLYRNSGEQPDEWRDVTYRDAAAMRELLDVPIAAYGSVQGTVHAWHQGSVPAFFQVRELSTGALVRCNYKASMHDRVYRAHKSPNAVVHVYGMIEWDRATGQIVEVDSSDLEIAAPLSDAEFQNLIGSAPNFTGALTTDEYIDWVRGDGE